jgi:hypothetical protein
MPLKGRVGRHASDGRQCQNWKSDQQTVIDLLNRIPATDGGTAGSLGGRIVAGYASKALYQAILAFEKKHFPGKAKGFVDPGGAVLAKLEALANRPPPARKPNKWDVLTTQSVRQALKVGVADTKLSHADAINIVRSTLSDGYITQEEIDDLRAVAQRSVTLEIRSARLLNSLATTLDFGADQGKPLELRSDAQKRAAEVVCKFMEGENNSHWRYLDRYQVGASLLMRIANPGAINQNDTSLCGPAAVFFGLAKDQPVEYAQFAIELFELGKAVLGGKRIEPHPYMKAVDVSGKIDQADWMTLGSLRSSENYYTAYWSPSDDLTAATEPGKISDWLELAGYSDVRQETNLIRDKGGNNLREASRLYAAGYLTLLFIDAGMLYKATQSKDSGIGDRHWVVLTDKVQIANDKSVSLKIYTWGDGKRTVPQDPNVPLALSDFLQNYHGFVAGRPW